MRRHAFDAPLMVLLAATVGCVTPLPTPYPSLRASADEMQRVATICLDPIVVGWELPDREQRLGMVEANFRTALEKKGYQVVAVADTQKATKALDEEGIGFFDPDTGALDAEGLRQTGARLGRSLETRVGCQALLSAAVVPVYVSFRDQFAEWDGVTQACCNFGTTGWLRALSFHVRLFDSSGREIYFSTGGIETMWRNGKDVDQATLLSNEVLIRDGVWASLAELPRRDAPAS